MPNPQIQQGVLNRVRCSVIVPNFTSLNITASYMGKSFAKVDFEGNFVEQIETGTGAVRSPEPYVMTTVTIGILRSQALAANWVAQFKTDSYLGSVNVHPDSSAFPVISINDTVIRHLDPGAFDGADPVVRLTLRGTVNINDNMWSF
ncbi:hypothetical protein [Paraburkholderia caledonica]|uniref:Phage tail protein n=1 Tax=Paraburkholderia caledonica TaxID=134536 RepID=A0AB73INW5_9BURK|nr:hypothetical protein [Paraburkholderia caledonica]